MALRQWLPGGPSETDTAAFWTGDVWKLLPILRKYRPDLRLHVLDCPPTGLVAITRVDPASRILADCYYDIVDEHAATVMDENRLRSFWEELEIDRLASALRGTRPPDHAVLATTEPRIKRP